MIDRRNFMKTCSGMGLAGTLLPGVLWAQAQAQGAKKITKEMIENAAAIADVPISEEYKEMMLENLNDQAKGYEEIYKLHIPNSVEPALIFDPVSSSTKFATEKWPMKMSAALRTTSLPAAGGLSALTAWRFRRGKLRSTSDRKMKNFLNRIMETPLRMRESYNI